MLLGITGFEIRYQLRNPVFWVAAAIFFLIGFGIAASENVSIGTPGAVHENAPYAIAVATAVLSLFYLFVVTAFVANAIVRDDSTGFSPIIRATSVTAKQIVIGRFIGGLIVAWIGYLAVPIGIASGAAMPWVDPETVGPQNISYYAWNFAVFAIPNIFLTCAILFAVATMLRSMMAAYIATVLLVMGFLASGQIGQKIEYRDAFARFEPLGTGALRETTRYWTQAEMNTRLVDLAGVLLFNRIFCIALGLLFLGFTLWRFTMTERAPSKRRLRRLARRDAKAARIAAIPPRLDGAGILARTQQPSRLAQFMVRLRIEMRMVLTSPGTFVITLFGVGQTAAFLLLVQSSYGTSNHPTLAATIGGVRGGFAIVWLLIAAFYGGELVWRERDRKINELIDSTPAPAWAITVPKIIAIFAVLLVVNVAAMLTGILYQLLEGSREIGIPQYVGWFIIPAAINGLLIAILAVFFQVLSPNKYVGWGLLFIWFVAGIFAGNMGYGNPLYNYGNAPNVPLSDFVGEGSFWWGEAVMLFYWLCFATILVVIAHLIWPRGTDLALRSRLGRIRSGLSAPVIGIASVALLAMIGTGAYAYYNIKVLNRYQTSDEQEKFSADYERKYLKYEKLPQPSITAVTLNVQLYPKKRMLIADGRYDLVNKTNAPLTQIHVRQLDQDFSFLNLQVAGAHLASDDKKFGYRIFKFDTPLAPGAKTALTFKSRIWHRGFRAFSPATDVI
jgi:ABC-2 type transport system permease protein